MALALYRRYRPDRLDKVIGQEHVTIPLARAIDSNQVHHAYLFSGPRGCGKTSTARILARSLNCEKGPTSNPCGKCESCQALAPGGVGTVDIVEIDAATHRGVDDARDLRERAAYAPIAGKYKIYIIDEAHQLTTDANNALLKLVEEPPAHLRFIFATTEPEKMLSTIRSRTHQYNFRLVSKEVLAKHMLEICEKENIKVEPNALLAIAQASGGSVRDALSLLGQLSAGVDEKGLTEEFVTWALGLTPSNLLSDLNTALMTQELASAMKVVHEACAQGIEPHRFLADFLEFLGARLREPTTLADLALVKKLSDAASSISSSITTLRSSTNPELALDLAIARLFVQQVPVAQAVVTTAPIKPAKPTVQKAETKKSVAVTELDDVKVRWSDVLQELGRISRVSWLVFFGSEVQALNVNEITIGISDSAKLLQAQEAKHLDNLKKVLKSALGLEVVVTPVAKEKTQIKEDLPTPEDKALSEKSGADLLIEKLGAKKIDEFDEGEK
ncbi:MAG: DNA polymerase III subunit gamma/tau [Candidatus Nanopelagicales bacterium]